MIVKEMIHMFGDDEGENLDGEAGIKVEGPEKTRKNVERELDLEFG